MFSKRKIRTFLLLLLCCGAAIGTARFCHGATKGFRLCKVRSNLIASPPSLASLSEREFVHALSAQKFHFLGRGLQSFVFASDDGKYVLKLFNNRYQRNIQLFSLLSRFPFVGGWAEEKNHYFQEKLERTFKSYEIAFDEMRDKTGLLYIHLKPTSNLPKLCIVDPLKICHEIDLNATGFLIQKRATLAYPALRQYVESQDIEGIKRALASLIDLFFWKWEQGIADNDPLIRTNYGFIEGKAVQIDVGPLSKRSIPLEERRRQIDRITASLKSWLSDNAPELLPFLDEQLSEQARS